MIASAILCDEVDATPCDDSVLSPREFTCHNYDPTIPHFEACWLASWLHDEPRPDLPAFFLTDDGRISDHRAAVFLRMYADVLPDLDDGDPAVFTGVMFTAFRDTRLAIRRARGE